ncbi:hypothetical protein ElyMa_004029200 [Elysia marginata]|uniref:DDE Tnp4 domain-containing protein n=1 Tax=Elysia marginata TaxID=1093978 RepID=A0AAV4G2R5_9GAST|nr:hypothetical protein ElyMa_004029200 [Elysia marginata]
MDHAPTVFELAYIKVGNRRHLLFFTKRQMNLLKNARRLFVDATFKVVEGLFTQLWSVRTFVKADQETKQMPLAFALMNGKRHRDYQAVSYALNLNVCMEID